MLLYCAALVLVIASTSYSAGIRMKLQMPQTVVAYISPEKPDIGLSRSLDSIPLLKSDAIQRRLTFQYDANSRLLIFNQGYGRFQNVGLPAAADPINYRQWLLDSQSRRLWKEGYQNLAKKTKQDSGGSLIQFEIPFKVPAIAKSIMGEGGAGLKVNGYRTISFSGRSQWQEGVSLPNQKQSKFPSLNMEQQSSFTISGNIGSKIFVDVNQDSKRQQSLANKIQLRYKGDEDDVVKTVELGNTNLSLPGTRFTGYSRSIQGLFGVKTTAELGGLKLTAIASQEKSSNQGASFKAGSESQTHVIRDYQFLDMTYFDLTRRDSVSEGDLQPGDSITNLELYFSVNATANIPGYTDAKQCSLYVDPFRKSEFTNENVVGNFLPYMHDPPYQGGGNFVYNPKEHYVVMDRPVTSDLTIGAYITFRRAGENSDRSIGAKPDNDTLVMKLIAHSNPQPNYQTWQLVWRNVYSLGGKIDDLDNLEVKIYKGDATNVEDRDPSELDSQDGKYFINLLGLDDNADNQIDTRNPQIIDPARGHLIFPKSRTPFADPVLKVRVDTLYKTNIPQARTQATKYYLLVKSSTRQSEFYLGHTDIVNESETVTLNGKPLKRDVDYRMYNDLGRITFLNQDALNPGADVKVDYEYAPLIAAEKKTLLGARGEYQISNNFKVGSTVLYKSEKTTDRKPRLGEEQTTALNLDADMSYSLDSKLLTKAVDALPFIETNVPSRISFDGEVAQSIPNANTAGEAYLDDFEGAQEQFSLGVLREGWHYASAPATTQPGINRRGRLVWYNPYDQVRVTDIYDRQVKAGEDRQQVLTFKFTPDVTDLRVGRPPDSLLVTGDSTRERAWGGVMKAFGRGAYDQSKSQFIELRMKGTTGVLHLDFGEISEDINNNGKLDNENDASGILKPERDVGLDGMNDEAEQQECNCTDADPHGDDWSYDNPYDYEHINGLEGNRNDPGINGRPDSEDLFGDGVLVTKNNYYSYSVDLEKGENIVPNSQRGEWYTVRIPFTDAYVKQVVGTPSRSNITTVRLWVGGVKTDIDTLQIADIQLSRNTWEVQPALPTTAVRSDSAGLKAEIVNTEQNRDYYSPPGVAGFYDQTTGLREKEQSLSLKYKELLPGDTVYAEKIPFKVQDLTSYRKLAMWVHGDSIRDSVQFFFRFGADAANYYEYRTTIDSGWSNNNAVNITFDEITQLKLAPKDTSTDSTHVIQPAHPKYRLVGAPTLTRIKYYAMGVVNLSSAQSQKLETGELWLDEMRTTDIRNDKGLAAAGGTTWTFGDVASFRADYLKQDAFFRNLTQSDRRDLGSGSANTAYGYSVDFKLDKLLPATERANIPISYAWRRSESSPRLITGSDIAVPANRVQTEKSINTSTRFQIGESWNKQTRNIVYGALLNRLTTSFSYDKSLGSSPTTPYSASERYTLKGRYAVTSPLKRGLKIFSWLQGMPLIPKRVLGTEFNPVPVRLTLDGTVNRSLDNTINSFNTATQRYLRTFQGRFETALTPLTGLDASYSFSTDRDLNDPQLLKFSFDPRQAKLGTERQYNQGFSTNYSPQVLPFITGTKFGYSVTHSENFIQTSTVLSEIGTRRIDNSRAFNASATFDIHKLLGTNPPKPKKSVTPSQSTRKGKIEGAPKDTTGRKEPGKGEKPKQLPDSLLQQPVFKDTTKAPSIDTTRRGGGTEAPKQPAPDSTGDTTSTKGGKRSSLNMPVNLGQTFALVVTDPPADTNRTPPPSTPPPQPTSPPKEEKKTSDTSHVATPPPASDSSAIKPDTSHINPDSTHSKQDTTVVKPDTSRIKSDTTGVKGEGKKGSAQETILGKGRGGRADSTGFVPGAERSGQKKSTPKGTPFYSFGLKFIRFFTDRVDPIAGSFRFEQRQSMNGFLARPSFLYRLGLSNDPGADRIATGGGINQIDQTSLGRGYTLRSGVQLIMGIKVGTSYSFSTSDVTGKATTDNTTTFPDLSFSFGKLDYLIFPKWISRTFTVDSKYSRKVSESVVKQTGLKRSRVTGVDYSPLVSVRIDWKFAQGLQSSVNYTRSMSIREDYTDSGAVNGRVRDYSTTLGFKTSYSFRGGSKLWLPLFGSMKIQSALSFDLDVSKRLNRTRDERPSGPLGVTAERTDFSVQPRITYNFSTNIKGSMSARWQDSNDIKVAKKSHLRELAFSVEIRF